MHLPRPLFAVAAVAGVVVPALGLTGYATSAWLDAETVREARAPVILGVPASGIAAAAMRRDDATSRAAAPAQWATECGMDVRARFERGAERTSAFYFTRGAYSSGRGWGGRRRGNSWDTDFPKADCQFNVVIRRLTNIDLYPYEHAITFDNPDLRRFPFLYILEVGRMSLTQEEIDGLRSYLLAGGFLMVDDFWGSYEWANFEDQIRQVLPEYPIVEIPLDHPLFNSFYHVTEVLQVPAYGRTRWGQTWEQDGYVAHVRGIFNEDGRLLVAINWNTDLGDAWEWAERPDYPVRFSTYAFEMGVNYIIYAMSH